MPNLPFTLRQLDVFASLCGTRSFRRSAEALGISQASVSNQIKALEHQLGISLFIRRSGQRPQLTPAGMAFFDDFRAFQAAGEALAAHRRRGPEEGPQTVRYQILIGQGLLDRYVRPKLDRFFAANPGTELAFDAQPPNDSLARDLADGRYDFAMIHRRESRPVEPYFRQLALVRGGIYGHRKFAEGRRLPLSADDINALPFIMPLVASTQEREVLQVFAMNAIRPRKVIGHTQYYDVMAAMLERGIGVSSLADAIIQPELREEVILLYPLENWRLLWFRRDAGGDPRCDAVQSFLLSAVLQDPNYLTMAMFAEDLLPA